MRCLFTDRCLFTYRCLFTNRCLFAMRRGVAQVMKVEAWDSACLVSFSKVYANAAQPKKKPPEPEKKPR